ncbi:MAG: hypothetical protein CMB80_28640 [Flammeovirgaceae bacterium]|jgi:hypothetical protein|nr:hypothetical protein [Flammeovirgaceae bacterium]|tara:strand:- start:8206 stop:8469 length:264 start_codon:yes stop_codon:yes gene_type:complete
MVGDAYESLMQWNCIFDDDELKEPCKLIQIDKHYTDSEIKSFREYLSKSEEYDKMIRDVNEPYKWYLEWMNWRKYGTERRLNNVNTI